MDQPSAGRPGEPGEEDDVVDADVVETSVTPAPGVEPTATFAPAGIGSGSAIAPDYNDAGVPSLNYLRDKIEGRYSTALGSTELAEAAVAREASARAAAEQQAAATAEEQRAAREQAAKNKLDEIRRSLHPGQ